MRRLSLRLRLTLVFATAMALVLAGLGAFLFLRLERTLERELDASLRAEAAEIVGDGEPGIAAADGRAIWQLLDASGVVLQGDGEPLVPASRLHGPSVFTTDAPGRAGDWRVAVRPAGESFVVVGASLAPTRRAATHLLGELAVGGPIALVLASLAGWLLAAAALRPVEEMRRRAEGISAGTPGRLPVPERDDEIARLGRTLNEMLARIEAAVEHERRFVADASHELRTPLALLKTELELALRRPRPAAELADALQAAAEETDRLTRIAEDLLLLARAQDGSLPLQRTRVDAAELLAQVAARFERAAHEQGRRIETAAAIEQVDADRLRLEQALGNLVDNALRYGEGTVRLTAARDGDGVTLRVADEGAGFPPEFVARAFERFSRADEARGRGGSGLGLAIVELVATAHGGSAVAENPPGGGAEVSIRLPD